MNVVCIGAGYVGTVTAAAFSALGHRTTVIDVDPNKVRLLNSGHSPVFEPGLEELVAGHIGKSLFAATSYEAVGYADIVFIAVGTPSSENGSADLRYVTAAAKCVGEHLRQDGFTVIANKSTVPVGTADLVASLVEEASGLKAEEHFAVASNPEFLREGYALQDVFGPDRIVVGAAHGKTKQVMRALYQSLMEKAPKTVYFETDTKTAELIKYASNAFLAVKISYINEMARLCDTLGADVLDLAKGMGMDSRIGDKFLQVSSGWSGSCFPKDTKELLITGRKYGSDVSIVEAAVASNERMHRYCLDKLQRKLKTLNGKRIGVLGLTFKPNTDDARETQASFIIRSLLEFGSRVNVHDPKGMEMFRRYNPSLTVQYCTAAEEAAEHADALVLLTHWEEYRTLNWRRLYGSMRSPYVLDTRNFLNREVLCGIGFQVEGLGY